MTQHAVLGASSSHRWMECPGSIGLAEREGCESESSEYAREGTAAHELAARCLERNVDPVLYVDTLIEVEGQTFEVTEDMAEHVAIYVDAVRHAFKVAGPDAKLFVEQRFDLAPLNPPAPMFGTGDAVIWRPATHATKANINGTPVVIPPKPAVLDVWDLKYGQGVVVEAVGNPQLRYYALGAVVSTGVKPERIRVHIVQPRAPHPDGVIRTEELTWGMLVDFKAELFAAAEATQRPDAPLIAGDWCRFCPASAVCPAQQAQAEAAVNAEFGALVQLERPEAALPVPAAMTLDEQRRVMEVAPLIEDWFSAVREHVKLQTEAGVDTGFKLVPKRATRRWADEETATEYLESHLKDDAYARKLRSPYQAEQRLKAIGLDLPTGMVIKQSSGTNLVPNSDPREALPLPAKADEDFEAIEPTVRVGDYDKITKREMKVTIHSGSPDSEPAPESEPEIPEADFEVIEGGADDDFDPLAGIVPHSEFEGYQPDKTAVPDEEEEEEDVDDIINAVRWRVETPDGQVWEGEAANEATARKFARLDFDIKRLPNHTKASRL